jgi:hypothetical protein
MFAAGLDRSAAPEAEASCRRCEGSNVAHMQTDWARIVLSQHDPIEGPSAVSCNA